MVWNQRNFNFLNISALPDMWEHIISAKTKAENSKKTYLQILAIVDQIYATGHTFYGDWSNSSGSREYSLPELHVVFVL